MEILGIIFFAIFKRGAVGVFPESAGKVALRRKTEISTDCGQRFVGITEKSFGFVRFFF